MSEVVVNSLYFLGGFMFCVAIVTFIGRAAISAQNIQELKRRIQEDSDNAR